MVCCDYFRFPFKSVWRSKVLLRAAFFAWSAALGKILTIGQSQEASCIVVNRCYMCEKNGESVDHLFHCEVAHAIWNVLFSQFGLCLDE
jgi:hypothetical protein